ncbi:MAG: conjugative transposon protein TraM, partial [Chitinophagaceae bacterium]
VDLDGMDGISVPESLAGEVTRLATERAIEGVALPSLDPSIGAKAASAGIEAAKALLNRKTKQIRIILKGGYRILLRDEKQRTLSSITY